MEQTDRSWMKLDQSQASKIVVKHLESFVGLTVKGLLLAAAISVATVTNQETISILGAPVPRESAALLTSLFFSAIFVTIILHGLNVLFASAHLPADEKSAKTWCLEVFLGAGVLSPLCCWPGRLGSACSALTYGIPFLLWWAMDIVQLRLNLQEPYALRNIFIALGVAVGWITGFSYVRLYRKLEKLRDIHRHVGIIGIWKFAAAVVMSWLGYYAYIADVPQRYQHPAQLVDIALAYPVAYSLPAWPLLRTGTVMVMGLSLVAAALIASFYGVGGSPFWATLCIGMTAIGFGLWRVSKDRLTSLGRKRSKA